MPEFVQDELKNYKINSLYEIPSVYGSKNNRIINNPVYVEKDQHYEAIVTDLGREFKKERPILVFFRNKEELISFYLSKEFQEYQKYSTYLTEEHTENERDKRIKNSSAMESITLMTNTYIRGIDFKLTNKKALEKGGFHAILTYQIET